ncbi:unnamed protein product [Pleuronectes platessa]|uniref:Uncharacterized protein n=1 Tax=Pleuronectes platessa TaxID=8262 RepID=A0A9N7W1V0_PLEPL|nr:unnamed protein product [Pleuronectes platessa]
MAVCVTAAEEWRDERPEETVTGRATAPLSREQQRRLCVSAKLIQELVDVSLTGPDAPEPTSTASRRSARYW